MKAKNEVPETERWHTLSSLFPLLFVHYSYRLFSSHFLFLSLLLLLLFFLPALPSLSFSLPHTPPPLV